jgi:oligo-alginate lyase
MTFGPYGGFHGHYDKLSFVFFGHGRELGVDPGRAASQAYRLPIHTRWYKASLGHNTVLVDRASQRAASGELECFSGNSVPAGVCAVAVARCQEAYPGVVQRRLLCLLSDYLLVVDYLSSDRPRRFDWVYHSRGSAVQATAATQAADVSQAFAGGEYLNNVKNGSTDAAIVVRFDGTPVTTQAHVAAGGDSEVLTGDGVGASIQDRVPLVMIGRHGTTVCFAAALEPLSAGQSPTVTAVKQDVSPEQVRVTVHKGNRVDQVTFTAAGKVRVESDGKEVLTK